jgi:hypothetical protein
MAQGLSARSDMEHIAMPYAAHPSEFISLRLTILTMGLDDLLYDASRVRPSIDSLFHLKLIARVPSKRQNKVSP